MIPEVRDNSDFIKFLGSDEILKKIRMSSKPIPRFESSDLYESSSLLDLSPADASNHPKPPPLISSTVSQSEDLSISATDAVIDLFIELFELKERNNWLRHQAIVILLQQLFGGTVERRVTENLGWTGELETV
jgi:hypothetical protein